jgi:hypothetical protein
MPENVLLESLPADLWQRIQPDLVPLDLSANEIIAEKGRLSDGVYFPRGCMISVVVDFANGRTIEAEIVGRHGYTGIAAWAVTPPSAT